MARRPQRAPREPLVGYRIVWLFVMFDLPVGDQAERRDYTRFRKMLLELGFTMAQFSIYLRCHPSEEKAQAIMKSIQAGLPDDGEVRILQVTDKQFGRMKIFHGKHPGPVEKKAEQLEFF